jgi:hypothetical protein
MLEQPKEPESSEETDTDDEALRRDEAHEASPGAGNRGWAVRGALLGGIVGATAGAGVGAYFARQPNALQAAKDALERSGRQLATSAAVAIGDVVASKSLKQLISGNGDGDRRELMKETAKEAAAAAAQATRDTIVSLRREQPANDAEAA